MPTHDRDHGSGREAPPDRATDGHSEDTEGSRRAQAPINAADAAHRAARAEGRDVERLRRDASGRPARPTHQTHARTRRLVAVLAAVAGIACAVLVIYVAGGAVVEALLADDADAVAADEVAGEEQTESVARVADGETIEAYGYTYSIIQQDGGSVFAYQYTDSDAAPLALFTVTGDPVGFVLYQGVFFVLSNADGRYYVQSYVHSDGSAAVDYYQGAGTMSDLSIDGSQLELTNTEGRTYTLSLAADE